MPMTLPPNASEVGEYAYLFESPAGANVADCYVSAHGGDASFLADGYYSITDIPTEFTVPAGCTVNFFADVGHSHVSAGGRVAYLKAISSRGLTVGATPPIDAKNTHAAGQVCKDYVLGKNLGGHGGNEQPTYLEMSQAMDDVSNDPLLVMRWLPHFVTIRNRERPGMNKFIYLSRLIKDVRRVNNQIVNFYCGNCRDRLDDKLAKQLRKKAGKQAYQG